MSFRAIRDHYGLLLDFEWTRENDPRLASLDREALREYEREKSSPEHQAKAAAVSELQLAQMTSGRDWSYLQRQIGASRAPYQNPFDELRTAEALGIGVRFRHRRAEAQQQFREQVRKDPKSS